jgi:hypothetical protein
VRRQLSLKSRSSSSGRPSPDSFGVPAKKSASVSMLRSTRYISGSLAAPVALVGQHAAPSSTRMGLVRKSELNHRRPSNSLNAAPRHFGLVGDSRLSMRMCITARELVLISPI